MAPWATMGPYGTLGDPMESNSNATLRDPVNPINGPIVQTPDPERVGSVERPCWILVADDWFAQENTNDGNGRNLCV